DIVVADTGPNESLLGQEIVLDAAQPVSSEGRVRTFYTQRASTGDGELLLFTSNPSAFSSAASPSYRLVVAVPAEDITSAWARLLPRLLLAGGGAGVVAV